MVAAEGSVFIGGVFQFVRAQCTLLTNSYLNRHQYYQSMLMCIRIAIAVVDTAAELMPHLQFTNSTNYNGH
jgi:hypothetical protein